MAGEVLADDNSPMMMTVAQYNDRVAYTWKLATEAEQERIVKLLEEQSIRLGEDYFHTDGLIALIKGESKPFITTKQAEELTNEMLEE